MDWQKIWNTIVNFFEGNIWTIVTFFLVLFFGLIVVKIFINIMNRIFNKTKMEKIAQQFIMGAIKVVLYLVLVLTLLSIIGVQISGIVTALSALILAVGVSLQGIMANMANGIILVASHMFKKGDFITVNGESGSVVDINFFFTTLKTADNRKVTIPNSDIVNGTVVNAGAHPTRRVDFTFSVAYESDVELVKKIVLDVISSNGKVYIEEGKQPFCRLKTLGASSIDFFANCWVDAADYWDVYYYVVENVYNEFKRNDISIPYNQLEIRNRTDKVVMPYNKDKLPARVEKERHEEKKFDLETANLSDILHIKKGKKKTKKSTKKDEKVLDTQKPSEDEDKHKESESK